MPFSDFLEARFGQGQPSGGGNAAWGGQAQNFSDAYAQLTQANQALGNAPFQAPQPQDDGGETRQLTGLERAIRQGEEFGGQLASATGWDPEHGFEPENVVRFLASLPMQMASGGLEGISSAYEAVTRVPLREADLEKNEVSTTPLDLSQQASSAANAFIDLAGLATGGSSRAIGTGAKVLSGGRVGENMAKGVFGRSLQTEAGRIGAQVAYDTAEEAGEEFAQSYLEDIRFKQLDENSLDRAITGAQWGALGGAAMSGGAHGVNYAMGNRLDQEAPKSSDQDKAEQVTNFDADFNALAADKGTYRSAAVADEARKQMSKVREMDGAGVFKHVYGNTQYGLNDGGLGSENMQAIFNSSPESARILAERFETDESTMQKALFSPRAIQDDAGRAARSSSEALNMLLGRMQNPLTVVVGRDPDTKNGGYKVDVKEFFEGQGLALFPTAYNMVGADVDGDTSGVYFDTSKLNVNGYVSEMLQDPEGKSNIDWYFSGLSGQYASDARGRKDLGRKVSAYLAPSTRTYGGESAADHWTARIADALEATAGRDDAISSTMNELRQEVDSMVSAGELSGTDGNAVISNLVRDVVGSPANRMAKLMGDQGARFENAIKHVWRQRGVEPDEAAAHVRALMKRGDLGSIKQPAQMLDLIGDMVYTLVDKGNPAYRKYGMLYYKAKGDHAFRDALSQASAFVTSESVFDDLIRAEFRMTRNGESPLTSIEALVHTFTLAKSLQDARISREHPVKTKEDLDRLLESYRVAYNEYAGIYNKCKEDLTSKGFVLPIDGIEKHFFGSVTDDGFSRSFDKTFGQVPLAEFLDVSTLAEDMRGMTWSSLIEEMSRSNGQYSSIFLMDGNPPLQSLLRRGIDNKHASERILSGRLRRDLASIMDNGMKSRIRDGKFDPRDWQLVTQLMGFFNNVMDVQLCIRGGLLDPETSIKTRIGQMLYTGSTGQRESAMVAFSMHWQFADAVEQLNGEDEATRQQAEWYLDSIYGASDIHRRIVLELLDEDGYRREDGTRYSPTLAVIEDLDKSFDEKRREVTGVMAEYQGDFFLDCLKTEDTTFDMSGFGDSLRKAEQSLSNARKAIFDRDIAAVEELERQLHVGGTTAQELEAFFKEISLDANVTLDTQLLGMQIWNATAVANKFVEKAVIDDASSMFNASLDHAVNGGSSSYLEEATSLHTDDVTLDMFVSNRQYLLRCFVDPNFKKEVFDPQSGRHRTMTRDALFRRYCASYDGGEPNANQMLEVLRNCPQLAGYLCQATPQPNPIGQEATVSHARASDLQEEFARWQNAHRGSGRGAGDVLARYQIGRGIQDTSLWLLNQSWYKGYIVSLMGEEIDAHMNPKWFCEQADKWHRILSRQFYQASHLPDGTVDETSLQKFKASLFVKTYSNNLVETSHLLEYSIMQDRTGSFDKVAADVFGQTLRQELANIRFSSAVIDIIGEDIGVEGGSSIMQALQDHVAGNAAELASRTTDAARHLNAISQLFAYTLDERMGGLAAASNAVLADDATVNEHLNRCVAWENGKRREAGSPAMAQDEIDALRAELDRINAEAVSSPVAIDPSDYLFEDADFATEADFKAKYAALAKLIGDPEPADLGTIWSDQLVNDNGSLRASKADAMKKLWKDKVFAHEMSQLALESDAELNANMYGLTDQIFDGIESAFHGEGNLREYLDSRGRIYDDAGYVLEDFTGFSVPRGTMSKTAQAIVTNLRIMDKASGSPMAVSRNGGQNKQMMGYAFVGDATSTSIPPVAMTAGDVLARLRDAGDAMNERWKVCIGDFDADDPSAYAVRTIGGIRDDLEQMAPDEPVLVFDPEDNPHGISDPHTPAAMAEQARPYHRLSGVIARIIDNSQEDMVLKAKKKFVEAGTIVTARGKRFHDGDQSIKPKRLSDPARAQQVIEDAFKKFRRDYRDQIDTEFQDGGAMEPLGFGPEQALLLAQAMTPGMKVLVEDADGTTRRVILDATHILGSPEAFAARWSEIVGEGTVLVVEPFTVPLVAGSYRAQNAVTTMWHSGENESSADDVHGAAEAALDDWSDFQLDSLGIDDIMSRVPPVNGAYHASIIAADSPTPYQSFLDAVYPGMGAASKGLRNPGITARFLDKETDRQRWLASQNASRNLGSLDAGYRIIQSFGSDKGAQNAGLLSEWRDTLSHMTKVEYLKAKDGAAILLDADKLSDAIKWGVATYQDILIPSTLADTLTLPGGRGKYSAPVVIDGRAFVRYSPYADSIAKMSYADLPSTSRTTATRESFSIILIDDRNFFDTADAHTWATKAASRFQVRLNNVQNVPASRLLPTCIGAPEIASEALARRLYDAVTDANGNMSTDEAAWKAAGFDFSYRVDQKHNQSEVMRQVYRYLSAVHDGKASSDGQLRNNNHGRDTVCCLVTDDASSGIHFAPVFISQNAPARCSYAETVIVDGDVWTAYDGHVRLDGKGRVRSGKLGGHGFTYKGETVPMPSRFRTPVVAALVHGKNRMIEFIANGDTVASRTAGRFLVMFKGNLYNYSLAENCSLLFEVASTQDGKPVWRWKESITSRPQFTPNMLANLAANNTLEWRKVADNPAVYGLTGDAEADIVISKVINQCLKYKIPPIALFSAVTVDANGNIGRHNTKVDVHMALKGLDADQTLRMFHYFMSDSAEAGTTALCPNGAYDASWTPGSTVFDAHGNMYIQIAGEDGKAVSDYRAVVIDQHDYIGDYSDATTPSGTRSWSWQHLYRRAADNGFLDSELADAILYSDFLQSNNEFLQLKTRLQKAKDPKRVIAQKLADSDANKLARSRYQLTYREREHQKAVNDVEKTFRFTRDIVDGTEVLKDPMSNEKLADAMDALRAVTDEHITLDFAMQLVSNQQGYTFNANRGNNTIQLTTLLSSLQEITEAIRTEGIPVLVQPGGRDMKNRYQVPLIDPYRADYLWEHSSTIRSHFSGDKQAFIERMKQERDKSVDAIKRIDRSANFAQKRSLELFSEWSNAQWGEAYPTDYLYSGFYLDDMMKWATELADMLAKDRRSMTREQRNAYLEMCKRELDHLTDLRKVVEKAGGRVVAEYKTPDGNIVSETSLKEDGVTVAKILNNATELSKCMALLNPAVMVGNVIDRAIHQGIMNAALHLGHTLRVGPYVGQHWLDQDIVKRAVNDPLFLRLYVAYRQAGFSGQELEFLSRAQNAQEINAWLDAREANMTKFQKACGRIYDISSGGNKLIKQQMANFINRFVMFAEEAGQDFWFEDAGGVTRLEAQLAADNGAGRWFVEVLGGHNAETPSLTIALQAMNSAKQGDMAQRHVITEMYGIIARRSPLCKFFVTTTVSRFPNYAVNVTERMLNWVMPMSSIRYVFTEEVARINAERAQAGKGQNYHFEDTQIHTSLREAMLVDVTHLGVGAVAAILVAMAGGLQPPDDEDKWGNTDEWLVCGLRVGEAWWIEDILGVALPLACFTKAAQLGQPRVDILTNGIAQACYNNPIIKVSDAVGFLLEPEGMFISDYNQDVINYQRAEGGPPSWTDWLQSNATSFGLSWVSQFITPSVVREWYVNAQDYEASYKRVYKESPTGRLTSEGEEGETEYTTYQDAMLRRTTRRNPVLGWLCNLVLNPQTGYMWGDMPDTIYYDDAQLAERERWSVAGMDDPAEVSAKMLELIAYMNQYSDMDQLAQTGFFLDTATKAALSQTIWDNVHELDEWWYGMQERGELSYYALGNGDFQTGSQKYAELRNIWQDQKQMWSNFYYDKVKAPALSQPLAEYRRYNTTYARDVNGDYYATGFRPAGVLPVRTAPGQLGDPEGTAGYENDWASISSVTGQPMEQRALVPVSQSNVDWPDLESWSDDGEGNGYSKLYQAQWGSGTSYSDNRKSSSSRSSGGGYSRSYSRGGGGGGRRYSRGGGSSPNIYSRYSAPNNTSPRTMDRVNLDRSQFDYIRPSFETKGSREAYRREDI